MERGNTIEFTRNNKILSTKTRIQYKVVDIYLKAGEKCSLFKNISNVKNLIVPVKLYVTEYI